MTGNEQLKVAVRVLDANPELRWAWQRGSGAGPLSAHDREGRRKQIETLTNDGLLPPAISALVGISERQVNRVRAKMRAAA